VFTGIIEEIGTLKHVQRRGDRFDLNISASEVTTDLRVDDSINVNGVCLTVVEVAHNGFGVQVVPQTLRLTALADYQAGDEVNLERAMAAGGRFGGHIVQGHVDETAEVLSIRRETDHAFLRLQLSREMSEYCIRQGSIAVDGVSLTIADLATGEIKIALIPHTLKQTTLGTRQTGDFVNIEIDVLSKYVRQHLQQMDQRSELTFDWLKEQGFE